MEPSGLMDKKSIAGRAATGHPPVADFTIYDLADEEVHFSRDSSDCYYQMERPNGPTQLNSSAHSTAPHLATESSHQMHSLDTNNLHFHYSPTGDYHNHSPGLQTTSSDQALSSKLLQTLGNKLRRGSNYLNAPTRLVGHYLLGITIQSWSEFFNTSRMLKAPKTRHQLTRRLVTNLSHFQGNYLCVSLILVVYCILTSPLLLLAIAAYLFALYLVTVRSALGKQTRIFGYRLNLQQQYSFITMLSLPPLWIAGAPSAVFWVIGASFFVVGLHASMFINNQVLNEQLALRVASSGASPQAIHMGRRQSVALNETASLQKSAVQYYNHYPATIGHQGYMVMANLQQASATNRPPEQVSSTTGSGQSSTGGSYMSSTISQWISFGGGGSGGGGGSKYLPARDHEPPASPTLESVGAGAVQVPDVKIISHDYAGLGRVYEI